MCFWQDAWIPWIKFYLEVRPSCLLYLLVTILEFFSHQPLKVLEDLKSLGLRVEDVPALMRAFLESGETIHLKGVDVRDLERTMGFLEEMYTKDEIQWFVLQQYLKDLRAPRVNRYVCNEIYPQHNAHVSDWASRLGFQEIANGIKAFCLECDMGIPESERVSSEYEYT
jgi:hypothetical protein